LLRPSLGQKSADCQSSDGPNPSAGKLPNGGYPKAVLDLLLRPSRVEAPKADLGNRGAIGKAMKDSSQEMALVAVSLVDFSAD